MSVRRTFLHWGLSTLGVLSLAACANAPATSNTASAAAATAATATANGQTFSTGGFAVAEIARPVGLTFATLTNPNLWPQINRGVTLAVTPAQVKLAPGVRFTETIASPVPGVPNWSNEWQVEELVPGKRFVMSGRDNFANTPIHSRLTYEFSPKDANTTLFRRSIEVTMSEDFKKTASKAEMEALYQFLGTQWEMAQHLKRFMESYQPQ